VFGLVWRPRVCLAHPVPGDGRSSGGSPEPERIERPHLPPLCSAAVPAQRDRSRRSGAALLHDIKYLRRGFAPPVDLECRSVAAWWQAVTTPLVALLASESDFGGRRAFAIPTGAGTAVTVGRCVTGAGEQPASRHLLVASHPLGSKGAPSSRAGGAALEGSVHGADWPGERVAQRCERRGELARTHRPPAARRRSGCARPGGSSR
jgi:hypothetical protein